MTLLSKVKVAGASIAAIAASAPAAMAQSYSGWSGWWWSWWGGHHGGGNHGGGNHGGGNHGGGSNAVPEIDAGAGLLALAAVLATLALVWELRRRRSKQV
ncbi:MULTISPECIES: VPEID-CTERM sorting domain-containing protein [unclassified Shimia]|uniref:VPEID-CTERM sorting domain-containing protein n=1 Tax=unclassified Shimia TaxID=2630038 RepID=UPI0031042C4D